MPPHPTRELLPQPVSKLVRHTNNESVLILGKDLFFGIAATGTDLRKASRRGSRRWLATLSSCTASSTFYATTATCPSSAASSCIDGSDGRIDPL